MKWSRKRETQIVTVALVALAAIFATFVCATGVPSLRHDWHWPLNRGDFYDLFINSTSGWTPGGFGDVSPYPTTYLVNSLVSAIGIVAGPLPALFLLAFGCAVVVTLGVAAIVRARCSSAFAVLPLAVFALFNPWVYSKVVAGHLLMILAFGATAAIVAETLRKKPRPLPLALLTVLVSVQIQFFILTLIVLAILAGTRRVVLPLITAAIISLPIAIGLILDRQSLLAIPVTLAWERVQSIRPLDSLLLLGYSPGYASVFQIVRPALYVIPAVALIAIILTRKQRVSQAAAGAGLFFLAFAQGVFGPLGMPFEFAVLHVKEIALFRELYDLLAYVCIAYVVLISTLAARMPIVRWVAAIPALAMFAVWFAYPPSRYWVDGLTLPKTVMHVPAETRFALLPAFQPLRFYHRGAGTDPNSYLRSGDVAPLNDYLPTFPVDMALGYVTRNGDASVLGALSVSRIYDRPWLRSVARMVRLKHRALRPRHTQPVAPVRRINAFPEMSLSGLPPLSRFDVAIADRSAFFADVAGLTGKGVPASWRSFSSVTNVQAPDAFVNPAKGWINARLAFAADPPIAQALGGALTTNPDALLTVPPGAAMLVDVTGNLRSSTGTFVSASTPGYRWVLRPPGTYAVRCSGACVVAGVGNPPPLPYRTKPYAVRPARFTAFAPWLVEVSIPPAKTTQMLRYNVRFEPHWAAFSGTRQLEHFRIATIANAWIIAPHSRQSTVWLIHTVSALQALAEILGACWALTLLALYVNALTLRSPADVNASSKVAQSAGTDL